VGGVDVTSEEMGIAGVFADHGLIKVVLAAGSSWELVAVVAGGGIGDLLNLRLMNALR
jgi:hypothetical protein